MSLLGEPVNSPRIAHKQTLTNSPKFPHVRHKHSLPHFLSISLKLINFPSLNHPVISVNTGSLKLFKLPPTPPPAASLPLLLINGQRPSLWRRVYRIRDEEAQANRGMRARQDLEENRSPVKQEKMRKNRWIREHLNRMKNEQRREIKHSGKVRLSN